MDKDFFLIENIEELSKEVTSLFYSIERTTTLSQEVKELLLQNSEYSLLLLKYNLMFFRIKYLYTSNKLVLDSLTSSINLGLLKESDESFVSQVKLVSRLESLFNMTKVMLDKVKKMNGTVDYQIQVIINQNQLV